MTHRLLTHLLLGAWAAAGLATTAQAYPRSDLPSLTFEHKDWELACDNTRTCRAAGYHAMVEDDDEDGNASILLTRPAGPDQPVTAELQLAQEHDEPPPAVLQMSIDGRSLGMVRIDKDSSIGQLSTAQVQAFLAAVVKDSRLAWTGAGKTWTISTSGANAVLLKMDDFQGRVGTPGALVRKGNKSEATVLPALPKPVIVVAPLPPAGKEEIRFGTKEERALLAALRKASGEDCGELEEHGKEGYAFGFDRLSGDKLLVSHRCWHGAYNTGEGYWVINARPPYSPLLVTASGTDYSDGVIESSQRGRGIADCMSFSAWAWDGRTFSQSLDEQSGMCRGIAPGGAWSLPTLVTEVRRQEQATR